MADFESSRENQVKVLIRVLENWRLAILPLKEFMLWKQPWYPCVLFFMVSFTYTIIWYLDLNLLTNLAILGLILNFVDFTVPTICNIVYGVNSWSGQKEQMFEDICQNIIIDYNNLVQKVQSFYSMRDSNPLLYYFLSVSILALLAWVTSTVNNLLLLYILSLILLLWPGVKNTKFLKDVMGTLCIGKKKISPKSM